jgi:MFS family permease
MLGLGVAAQVAGTYLWTAPAYLIPLLHLDRGLPLDRAGLIAAAPTFGGVLTLVLWGALTDRYGERVVIAGGLGLSTAFALLATLVTGYVTLGVVLVLCGAAVVSTNAASGRVVVGWFPPSRRGLGMGIRQMAQPIAVGVAALSVPALAKGCGLWAPFAVAGVATGLVAVVCALCVVDPPRSHRASSGPAADEETRTQNPYRGDRFLLRIHTLSVLLVVPQFTLSTYGLVWLIAALHWSAGAAGAAVAASQFIGAGGRILVGALSDRVGSRVRVLRWVCLSGVFSMLVLAGVGASHWAVGCALCLVVASVVSVADNGLSFTSVAEAAGPMWAGRGLGLQNTAQFVAASAVGPGVGALIAAVGYPIAFALVAVTPLVAFPLVPRHDQQRE